MSVSPRLPPLFTGEWVPNQTDPFDKAVSRAIAGVDSGTIFYSDAVDVLRAALVLAPETSLEEAVQVVYVAQIGLAESLGALAPPEVPVFFQWPDRIKVNGAVCGGVRFAADVSDPSAHPNWLVVGIDVPFCRWAASRARRRTRPVCTRKAVLRSRPWRFWKAGQAHIVVADLLHGQWL